MIVNSTDLKTNLGKYLKLIENEDIIITRNGKPAAKLIHWGEWDGADVIREGAPDYTYDQRQMTYEEFMAMYDDTEARFEYIDGVVYAMGSPSYTHQKIISYLNYELFGYFKDKSCKPYVAPFDVHLSKNKEKHVVQPDLFVICDPENVIEDKYYGIPTLTVEVLSPSTRKKDLIKKLNLYVDIGIKEYVIVDPKEKKVLHWLFSDNNVESYKTLCKEDIFQSYIFENLKIDIANVF